MTREMKPGSLSRRSFMLGVGATLALPLLPGCGLVEKFEDQNCGSFDCTSLPMLEVDIEFRERVENAAEFIRSLMRPSDRDFPIILQRSEDGHSGGLTQPGNTPLYSGPLVVRLFLPDSSVESAQLAEKMVVHEAVHAYDISTGYELSRRLGSEMQEGPGQALDQTELSVFDESTYSKNPLYSNHGHPDASYDELLASTVNVLKTYPRDFIEIVNRLPADENELVFKVASVCLGSLVDFAYAPTIVDDLPFDPVMINFLRDN